MPTLRNVSPYGDLDIPLINRLVEGGAEFEVSDEHARILLDQDENYEAVDDAAKGIRGEIEDARAAAGKVAEHGAPAKSAKKTEWVAWAVANGADETEAEAMTKDQLVDAYGADDAATGE